MRSKQRTRGHVIADLSRNHVERFVLRAGHTLEPIERDYGIDLVMYTYDGRGWALPGHVSLQLKATDRPRVLRHGQVIALAVQRSDLNRWLAEIMPLMLIVYDAARDMAYWLYVQAYFEARSPLAGPSGGATLTVHLPTTNRVDDQAIARWEQFLLDIQRQAGGRIRHHE